VVLMETMADRIVPWLLIAFLVGGTLIMWLYPGPDLEALCKAGDMSACEEWLIEENRASRDFISRALKPASLRAAR
jgi:hypothetical protein